MRTTAQILFLLFVFGCATRPQNNSVRQLNIGDPAPELRASQWFKGKPIQKFKKGQVYVVEFWATWCAPCRAEMPRLSVLAEKYRKNVTVIGMDIMENKTMDKVKRFVDSMGTKMNYHVAADDEKFMETHWYEMCGEKGIPKTIVINENGKVAWMGHPHYLEPVLIRILNKEWDIQKELVNRNMDRQLKALDDSLSYELIRFVRDLRYPDAPERTDSALLFIYDEVRKEPKLKYAPRIAHWTFRSLIQTNPQEAYEYGKIAIVTPTYAEAAYDGIIGTILTYSPKLNLPSEIYQLGIEAYKMRISNVVYTETSNMPKYYNTIAEWYWRVNDKSNAIESQQKAIEWLKIKEGLTAKDMSDFELRLQKYKEMKLP